MAAGQCLLGASTAPIDIFIERPARSDPAVGALPARKARSRTVPVSFAVNAEGELYLRMPDESGTGVLSLVFVPRASP